MELKQIIAKNICLLRQKNNMTQLELAELLHFSDKAVSKWERAESLPDFTVFVRMAEIFGVKVDYFTEEEHREVPEKENTGVVSPEEQAVIHHNHKLITALAVLGVFLIATMAFVVICPLIANPLIRCLPFVYAVPVSLIVWLVLNSLWFNIRINYLIVSVLMWSVLATIYLSLLCFDIQFWLLFVLGIPGQFMILTWSGLNFMHRKGKKE